MEEKKPIPLKVINAEAPKTEKSTTPDEGKEAAFELPTGYLLAKEMQEIFDEDKVTHRQGSAEPEAD